MNAPKKVAVRNLPLHPRLPPAQKFEEEFYALVANKGSDLRYWTQFAEVWGEVNGKGFGEGDATPPQNIEKFWAGDVRICAPISKPMAAALVRMKRKNGFRSLVLHKRTRGSQLAEWSPKDEELERILGGPKERPSDKYSAAAAQERSRAKVAELFASGVINVGIADKSSPRPKRT